MLEAYRKHVAERAEQGVVPQPLNAEQTAGLVELLKNPPAGEESFLLELITDRVPPGVDEAAYVKAGFLSAVAKGEATSPLIDKAHAVKLLGTMQGGYNIATLVELLDDAELAETAAEQLKHTLLMFDAFHDVAEKAKAGNAHAKAVLESWAEGEWFKNRPALEEKITLSVFKVVGETNTDDLSPAPDAWSRPDIPLHALAMLKMEREGIKPDVPGSVGPIKQMEELKAKGYPVAYVGDVVGTGSSRKSATNSVLWFFGDDIPNVPNKRAGGFCFGTKIAPIFYNTMEDAGALPIEFDCTDLAMGDVIDVYPYKGEVRRHGSDELVTTFELKTDVLLDEVRAGGRIPLIIGRGLTERARAELGMGPSDLFKKPEAPADSGKGFTLAQKMVGRACGLAEGQGVRPGTYCEPKMTTVGSQDTTGPMTRDELKDLACLGFSADLVMQSFCHTAAYPKPIDVTTHHTLPDFIRNRGGVSLRPGDGIIHSWLNRMLLPDTVGTGGDSHTRFPMGISFPAGSGLVAFAAATGVMPLDMPESVLVRFKGKMNPGITLRDLVHAIPYYAIQEGLLTVEKKGKKNIFSGRILEIEGLNDLTVEQAFELSDASAERSAAGCTIKLPEEAIAEYLKSNITMLRWMIGEGYGDARTLERRAQAMEAWLAKPELLEADKDAEYAAVIEIDLAEINQPILCAPNDPDDARLLSEVAGRTIDEVFIGSCMTNIGHFRAAGKLLEKVKGGIPTRLWLAPPTRMDQYQLTEEGYYGIYGKAGARMEMPGCSLCMGNQARVQTGATVVSTSTRNFPNRLGDNTDVFLASAELAAVSSILGKLPTVEEYMEYAKNIDSMAADIYRYLSFDQIASYKEAAANAEIPVIQA
ncbi:bifunctional aconitate hydratase 2/2-methylisocitrate dehydratase [Thiopseudomonas alkaliphila]|uniref:bifunctional aconitate hydratase 2/2-methylisocitrate dehydratase n=1 Tax=Thiopseudomonas alkaliphila TaxID=1697053 RepID=UPI00069D8335|nr:bifunctional aconitate hydratase 2/2-methylisocitrate dehydratase [Thiopseudomonas alkaliphila]AKX44088.1 bifunctional aconitate hydratase 2/2-methylisocitrate dehydratase [Thiopseudomonas alkaliphila]AKX46324.1 bifunctional aconitate hydratase 2/2-methylisocitrate dehydratase [Thiopseudomonas alkaliphila]AKX49394.1 bifunctional aconitate hydratase 2/2-methylisocitrate dehydratase [Thiopseudomonas alkaliphila]AKX50147.1 bifunctional aconitate hydratase 2/2-methylisocitrate dehydratase [Thiop